MPEGGASERGEGGGRCAWTAGQRGCWPPALDPGVVYPDPGGRGGRARERGEGGVGSLGPRGSGVVK